MDKKYFIKIWETEYERDAGFSYTADKTFDDLEKAITFARDIFEEEYLASLEIMDSKGTLAFFKDRDMEEFYNCDRVISKVSNNLLGNYIYCWTKNKQLPIDNKLLYARDNNIYVAVDNTTNNCWTEEINSEKEAQKWLLDIENQNELMEERGL